jgi:hypothetical protein
VRGRQRRASHAVHGDTEFARRLTFFARRQSVIQTVDEPEYLHRKKQEG